MQVSLCIEKKVMECDFNDEQYDEAKDGFAVVYRGATGRWCEVMHGGPELKAVNVAEGSVMYTAEEARTMIENNEVGEDGDWADF